MNIRHYEDIMESFKNDHPYMVKDLDDWSPKGRMGVRVLLRDGSEYDYDMITRGVRNVKTFNFDNVFDITDEVCRESIAYHLVELMALKGFSQHTLSQYTGISVGAINSYVNGRVTPSVTVLRKIAYVLDCPLTDLID